ncbi:MAG TPA: hypothetical protein VJ256_02010 [Dehalococcoidia bacterium]|nr:hypothetical protein [Dehalococcoidia bacterium]
MASAILDQMRALLSLLLGLTRPALGARLRRLPLRPFPLLVLLLIGLALAWGYGQRLALPGSRAAARALAALASPEVSQIRLYNTGAGSASLLVDYYDQSGNLVFGGQPVTLAGQGGLTVNLKDNPQLPSGFRGSAAVSSSQPLASLLIKDSVGPPPAHAVANGVSQGFPRLYLPLVMRSYGNPLQSSRFTIQSLGDKTGCLGITYWDPEGRLVFQESPGASADCPQGGIVLGPQGSLSRDQVQEQNLGSAFLGGALVEALPGADGTQAPLAAVVEMSAQGRAAAYTALGYSLDPTAPIDDVGPTILLPLLYRRFGGWSSLAQLQRVDTASADPVTVTITYYPYGSSKPLLTKEVPLLRLLTLDLLGEQGLPEGFVGSAIVRSPSPLAAVVNLRSTEAGGYAYTAYGGLPTDKASLTPAVPLVYRNHGGTGGRSSSLSFQVADGGEAQVTIAFRADGAGNTTFAGPIPIRGSLTLSLRSPLFPLPDDFVGAARVTASAPIVVLAHDWATSAAGDTTGTYGALAP